MKLGGALIIAGLLVNCSNGADGGSGNEEAGRSALGGGTALGGQGGASLAGNGTAGSSTETAGAAAAGAAGGPAEGSSAGSTSAGTPSVGGTSNGGTSNGGTSNGGTSNGGTSNGGTSNGGTSNGGNGGVSSGGTTNGSAGQASYDPCPKGDVPCKIMPLGDSITGGYRSSDLGGYRTELFQAALTAKKKITLVGSQSQGPDKVSGVAFPKSNEGHGGYTIDGALGLEPQIAAWMKAASPDIVALMVGTNDVNNFYAWKTETAAELAAAPSRLGKLCDAILNQDAHVLLLVAQITPTSLDAENKYVETYNAAIPALVKERADAGKHIRLVDMYTPFVETSNYQTTLLRGTKDTLHPANAGYKLMGDVWYESVKAFLP